MNKNLILPPNYPSLSSETAVIFLAGPIQGAPNWHDEAINYFQDHAPHIYIASPKKKYLGEDFVYNDQVNWESHFLHRAAQKGCVLFFLAKEAIKIEGRAYAQTTRFELGEWKARQLQTGCNMVVGIQQGFSNARYIKWRIGQENTSVPICSDLQTTCQTAIDLIGNNN